MMTEQVLAQALLLTGELEDQQQELLRLLCNAAVSGLTLRLKDGLTPEDCTGEFVSAASLLAVAALDSSWEEAQVEEFKAGDLTVRQSGGHRASASAALEKQAWMLMKPYLVDSFAFMGV